MRVYIFTHSNIFEYSSLFNCLYDDKSIAAKFNLFLKHIFLHLYFRSNNSNGIEFNYRRVIIIMFAQTMKGKCVQENNMITKNNNNNSSKNRMLKLAE